MIASKATPFGPISVLRLRTRSDPRSSEPFSRRRSLLGGMLRRTSVIVSRWCHYVLRHAAYRFLPAGRVSELGSQRRQPSTGRTQGRGQ